MRERCGPRATRAVGFGDGDDLLARRWKAKVPLASHPAGLERQIEAGRNDPLVLY